MANKEINIPSNQNNKNELSSEMQKQVAKVQDEFARKNNKFKLLINPTFWKLDNNERAYSCTITTRDGQTCSGCDTNFLISESSFSLEEVMKQFEELKKRDWSGLANSEEAALSFIAEQNNGQIPEELR